MDSYNLDNLFSDLDNVKLKNSSDIEEFKNTWLSKKGVITSLMQSLKDLSLEQKKQAGQQINLLKQKAEGIFNEAFQSIEVEKLANANQGIDLTLPGNSIPIGAIHPLNIIRNRMVEIFSSIGFTLSEGNEIVDDWHNFTALNLDENHPARDMQDTFFIKTNPDILLRTQTSSVQVKVMQSQAPPIKTISPGSVFRKDSDSTHSPHFHQMEGLYVDKNLSFADLKKTLLFFVNEMFGQNTKVRFRPSYFPFTEPSAEMDIWYSKIDPETGQKKERWMEILGCGMVDPQVFINCGIDPEIYSGFAFGIGIERIAMVKYQIPDIKLFFENDIRFLKQFSYAL